MCDIAAGTTRSSPREGLRRADCCASSLIFCHSYLLPVLEVERLLYLQRSNLAVGHAKKGAIIEFSATLKRSGFFFYEPNSVKVVKSVIIEGALPATLAALAPALEALAAQALAVQALARGPVAAMDSPAPGAGGGRSSSFEFTLTADELALLEEVESSLGGTSLSSLHDADLVNSVPDDVRAELAALDRLVESYVPGVAAARDVGANDDDDDDDDDDDVEDVSKKDEALSAEKGGTHGAAGEKEASAPRGGTSAGAFVADKLYEMITAKDLEPVALAQAEALSGVASSTERLRAFNAMSRDFLDGSGGTALSARVQEVSDLLARMASVSHRVQNLQRRVHFAQQRQRARQ